jgi:hypothetical protein
VLGPCKYKGCETWVTTKNFQAVQKVEEKWEDFDGRDSWKK